MSSKADMRREAQSVRDNLPLSGDEGELAAARLIEKFTPFADNHIVAAYWPIKRELDTLPLLEKLHGAGTTIALPVVMKGQGELTFRHWAPDTNLVAGTFGVMVPPDDAPVMIPDTIILPLLAFDRRGNRLGYGGGYYDRTLAALRAQKTVTAIGYGYAEQICLFPLPRDEHDIRMDYIVTPQNLHDFT